MIYRAVRSEILDVAEAALASAMEDGGINTDALRVAIRDVTMPFAIQKMGERLATEAPGVKEQNPFS